MSIHTFCILNIRFIQAIKYIAVNYMCLFLDLFLGGSNISLMLYRNYQYPVFIELF